MNPSTFRAIGMRDKTHFWILEEAANGSQQVLLPRTPLEQLSTVPARQRHLIAQAFATQTVSALTPAMAES